MRSPHAPVSPKQRRVFACCLTLSKSFDRSLRWRNSSTHELQEFLTHRRARIGRSETEIPACFTLDCKRKTKPFARIRGTIPGVTPPYGGATKSPFKEFLKQKSRVPLIWGARNTEDTMSCRPRQAPNFRYLVVGGHYIHHTSQKGLRGLSERQRKFSCGPSNPLAIEGGLSQRMVNMRMPWAGSICCDP